jgi:hypothetical protein
MKKENIHKEVKKRSPVVISRVYFWEGGGGGGGEQYRQSDFFFLCGEGLLEEKKY